MNLYLNELELLKVARDIEEEGFRFYTQSMENAKNEDIKKIFKLLADEEKAHANLFAKIYSYAKEENLNDDDYIFDEQTSAYLKAISDTAIFNTKGLTNAKINDAKDSKDALIIGMQAEKDAILFYTNLLRVSKYEQTKKYLNQLIEEENGHLENLINIYKAI